jgi:hypothetical protein
MLRIVHIRDAKMIEPTPNNTVTILDYLGSARIEGRFHLWLRYNELVINVYFNDLDERVNTIPCEKEPGDQIITIVLRDNFTITELASEIAYCMPIHHERISNAIDAGETEISFMRRPGKKPIQKNKISQI